MASIRHFQGNQSVGFFIFLRLPKPFVGRSNRLGGTIFSTTCAVPASATFAHVPLICHFFFNEENVNRLALRFR